MPDSNEPPRIDDASTDAPAAGNSPADLGGVPSKSTGASPHVWVSTTYFVEGLPYAVVNNTAELIWKELGAGLGAYGLTSLFHLPWNLKFLWASVLDRTETKRSWLVAMQLVCALLIFALGVFVSSSEHLRILAVIFLVLAFASATNDVAIDGYYMEALEEDAQSRFVGYRAMAYRVATLLVKGPLLVLVGWYGFRASFFAIAGVLVGLALFHAFALPRAETRRASFVGYLTRTLTTGRFLLGAAAVALAAAGVAWGRAHGGFGPSSWLERHAPAVARISLAGWIGIGLFVFLIGLWLVFRRRRDAEDFEGSALASLLSRTDAGRLLLFVVLFRTGESLLQKMKWPFFSDELGLTLAAYGVANGTVGVAASFVGTLVGGRLIARDGLEKWFWPFLLAQNVSNLLYVGLALVPGARAGGVGLVSAVITLEEFASGLGTAVLMVCLMRVCKKEHKAAHFALLTALMSISFTFAGAVSGFLATAVGYAGFFFLTFVATWPMMILASKLSFRVDS